MYLVDTSVWINFLRGQSDERSNLLEALLQDGDAYLCEVTYSEICFGAKDQRQFEKFSSHFSALPFLFLPFQWHREASRMGCILKREGYKPFLADLMIALTALSHKTPLITQDNDFKPYQKLFGLSLA